ncbi:protein SRG1-like [Senna tora]|uniref:Protein SRG1-like n=1 Tax=Senna tora TaxID=362788 RepID=A0A834W3V2_9FABA|nr:protein SRG1-like [Senna tora]
MSSSSSSPLLPRLVSSRIHHFLSASSQLGISLQVLRFADLVEKHSNELAALETWNNGSEASKWKAKMEGNLQDLFFTIRHTVNDVNAATIVRRSEDIKRKSEIECRWVRDFDVELYRLREKKTHPPMESMEATLSKAGFCVGVPCVQELAKQTLSKVPERYVRPEVDLQLASKTLSSFSSSQQIPIIDMTRLLSPEFHASELHKLDYACKHWGFFQLTNHGVSTSLVENVKRGVEDFFNLPIEEKKKFGQKEGDREGFGQLFVVSEEQKLDWGDMFYCITLPQEARKPHLFPKLSIPFRDNLDAYCEELRKLANKIIQLLFEALNMEAKEMAELLEGGRQSVRMNYYPPCPEPDKVIGFNPHSDVGILTILLQINEMEGLQIKNNGNWIHVNPLPNAFVINLGDVFEILSNGIYQSVEHRATVNSEKERMSMATFLGPKLDGILGPSLNLVTPERPAQFKRISVFDYFKGFFTQELRGKSHLDSIRIKDGTDHI